MRRFLFLALAIALLSTTRVIAQGDPSRDPNLNASLEPAPRVVDGRGVGTRGRLLEPSVAWGPRVGGTYIAASQFSLKNNSAVPDLQYEANHFYSGSGRYFAQLAVEPGMFVIEVMCYYNDSHASDDVQFQWQRYTTDVSTGTTSSFLVDSFQTTGAPGIGSGSLIPPNGEQTIHVLVDNGVSVNPVNHYLAVDLTPNISFTGCAALWTRVVAPAPMTATFSDVPTSHPYFRWVEALAGANITAGCGGGLYCVNNPITRGEMAVFLAVALGVGSSQF